MVRRILFLSMSAIAVAIALSGCAGGNPAVPDSASQATFDVAEGWAMSEGPNRLWGEWTLYINAAHDGVEVVPRRVARLHLNAVKFLEDYCTDCVNITGLHNNGDQTIDLTVQITHPFPDSPEYTGFDVKGIVMFRGSHEMPHSLSDMPLHPQNYRLSWRLMGDPELLNADGFTYLWSPWYDSGSSAPIFNYRQGKYSNGTPTANVNGFLNYYSNENRHIFEVDEHVGRTYHIWLPTGPVAVGYAIDACWEPPTVTPVTDPVSDFPYSANQPELYHFKCVINDGLPLTPTDGCCLDIGVHEARAEMDGWYFVPPSDPTTRWVGFWNEEYDCSSPGYATEICDSLPDHPDWRCLADCGLNDLPDGEHQFFGFEFHAANPEYPYSLLYPSIDVIEIIVDME
jgi:hypothetical protein